MAALATFSTSIILLTCSAAARIVTDFSQSDCVAEQTATASYYYWANEGGPPPGLPACKAYKPEGHFRDACAKAACPPAYRCDRRCNGLPKYADIPCRTTEECRQKVGSKRVSCVDMCVIDDASCMAYHANTTDYRTKQFSALKFKPACDEAGAWAAKQCKGGVSGKCYCFDATGGRLFGQALFRQAAAMTCECSRRRAELEAAGRPVTLHCDSMGNYEPLQCDSGLCWCSKPPTVVVPERAMPKLPCYDQAALGGQYLRQCESKRYAVAEIMQTLRRHGVRYANLESVLCDGDGGYGAYNVSGGIAYCTWRDGTKIGTWQSESGADIGSITCNCARDYKMYGHAMRCAGNGNYDPLQNFIEEKRNYYYCVDRDGFAVSDNSADAFGNCTKYY